jgi:hypothetical protein
MRCIEIGADMAISLNEAATRAMAIAQPWWAWILVDVELSEETTSDETGNPMAGTSWTGSGALRFRSALFQRPPFEIGAVKVKGVPFRSHRFSGAITVSQLPGTSLDDMTLSLTIRSSPSWLNSTWVGTADLDYVQPDLKGTFVGESNELLFRDVERAIVSGEKATIVRELKVKVTDVARTIAIPDFHPGLGGPE